MVMHYAYGDRKQGEFLYIALPVRGGDAAAFPVGLIVKGGGDLVESPGYPFSQLLRFIESGYHYKIVTADMADEILRVLVLYGQLHQQVGGALITRSPASKP